MRLIGGASAWLTGFAGDTADIKYGHKGIMGILNDAKDGYTIWGSSVNEEDTNIALDYYNEDNAVNPNPYEYVNKELVLREGSLKITKIQMSAFKNTTLNSLSIGKFSDHEIRIESSAFAGPNMKINGIYFGENVKFLSENGVGIPSDENEETVVGPSVSVFARSQLQTVVLPSKLEIIGESMFESCSQLTSLKFANQNEENKLSPKIKTIKAAAFAYCGLSSLIIPNNVLNIEIETSTGSNVSPFEGWQNETVGVFFKASETKPNGWDTDWLPEGINPKYAEDTPAPQVYTVTLEKVFGIGGTNSVQATYGKAMPTATAPTRIGYVFAGYFTKEDNVQYYKPGVSGIMVSVRNWDRKGDAILYAAWTPASNPNPNPIPNSGPNLPNVVIDLNLDVLKWNNDSILNYLNKDLILLPPSGKITPPSLFPPTYR